MCPLGPHKGKQKLASIMVLKKDGFPPAPTQIEAVTPLREQVTFFSCPTHLREFFAGYQCS